MWKIDCNTILYIVFYYFWEPVLSHQILIGFAGIQENNFHIFFFLQRNYFISKCVCSSVSIHPFLLKILPVLWNYKNLRYYWTKSFWRTTQLLFFFGGGGGYRILIGRLKRSATKRHKWHTDVVIVLFVIRISV